MALTKLNLHHAAILVLVGALTGVAFRSGYAEAAPVSSEMAAQKITIQVKRSDGSAALLKGAGLQAKILPHTVHWEYIAGTQVSVPFIQVQFTGLPNPNPYNILVDRSGVLEMKPGGPILSLPLLKKRNSVLITVVNPEGLFENWAVSVVINLSETAVFVDESCKDYLFKFRELRRNSEASLIYLGCQTGLGAGDMSLELLWSTLERVEYRGQNIPGNNSIVTIPLDSKRSSLSEVVGVIQTGGRDVFQVEYEPYQVPPFEVWAGLAFFRNTFEQSNFDGKYSQLSSAFIGQFWFRPEDTRLSVMLRGFGSLVPFSQKLDPDQGYSESVRTFFVDAELRFKVFDKSGWRIDPFFGGWVFFQTVESRNFGIQRIIDPVLGLMLQKKIGKRDLLGATFRFAPLQAYFNPLALSFSQSYAELELTYSHALKKSHKYFGTVYLGSLQYEPEGMARSAGTYLVLGGGYGW